jgi:hypothetical protein
MKLWVYELDSVYILCKCIIEFLGAFAKFRKAIISFVMSVRPSVRMELL